MDGEVARLTASATGWIHPFLDGNGRTARAVAYLLICRWQGGPVPGEVMLPELIKREPIKYHRCLEEADRAWKRGAVNVSALEGFLLRLLRRQVSSARPNR